MEHISITNDKGEEIGYLDWRERDDYLEQIQIFVREDLREQGIGKQLLEKLRKIARSRKIDKIGVTSTTDPETQVFGKWLVAMGFKRTGESGSRYPQWALEIKMLNELKPLQPFVAELPEEKQKEFDEWVDYLNNFKGLNFQSLQIGYIDENIKIAEMIPKDKIVVDVGCGFGFQHILYKNHKGWIGIQDFWHCNATEGAPELKVFTPNAKIIMGRFKNVWQQIGITDENKNQYFGVANHSLWLPSLPESEEEDVTLFNRFFAGKENNYITSSEIGVRL